MQKPTTDRLWRCVRYYLALCLSRGQADDTIRAKKYASENSVCGVLLETY